MDVPKRDPVHLDRAGRSLRVGDTILPIAPLASNETILTLYVNLVRRQRGLSPSDEFGVRAGDIAALAPVLDLDDSALADQIIAVIGLSGHAAQRMHAALVRRRVLVSAAFGAAGVAALTGVGVIHVPLGSSPASTTAQPATATESTVAPDIGEAVVITPPPTTDPAP